MFLRFVNWLTLIFFSNHTPTPKYRAIRAFLFSFPVLSIILIAGFSYQQTHHNLTQMILQRRQAISHLSALVLKEKFDRLIQVGISLASRVRFRALIQEGKWDEAIQILKTTPEELPYIERIFITDTTGTMMTDFPPIEGVRRENFSFRNWYQGVSKDWKPFISNVYKRTAIPQYNVVTVAIPIWGAERSLLAILGLQLKLDTVLQWNLEIPVGSSGFVYFVDRSGTVAAHPKFPSQGDLVNFQEISYAQQALQGQEGVTVAYNPMTKDQVVASYEPIPHYGWGVVAEEPAHTAFLLREKTLNALVLIYALIVILNLFLIYFIKRIFEIIQKHRQILQDSLAR